MLDARGEPVAEALVLASTSSELFSGHLPLDAVGAESMPWMERVSARSDANGRFALAEVRPGALRLAVRSAGHAPLDVEGLSVPAEAEVELDPLQLSDGVVLSGRVLDESGRPVPDARVLRLTDPEDPAGGVLLLGGGAGALAATTGPDGSFVVDVLASGPWALRFESPVHPFALLSGATDRPGERVDGLLVTLELGHEIAGRVEGAPASELEELEVAAVPVDGEDGALALADRRRAGVGPAGGFTLRGLREGSYRLHLQRRRPVGDPLGLFLGGLAESVLAETGRRDVRIAWQPEAALVFQVVDARTGAPIETFDVEAGIDWRVPLREREGGGLRREHPEGRVRFGDLRPRSPADTASLHVEAPGYAPYDAKGIRLLAGQETELGQVALEPLPRVTVRVSDAATGAPVAGARVTLQREDPPPVGSGAEVERRIGVRMRLGGGEEDEEPQAISEGDLRTAQTDAEGVATLGSFEGQSCRVRVEHGGHAPYRSELFTAPLGAYEHRVQLGRGGTVVARLVDREGASVPGGRIEHRGPHPGPGYDADFGEAGEVTDGEGRVVFEHLEPGAHRFRAQRGPGGGLLTGGGGAFAVFVGGDDEGGGEWFDALVTEGGVAEVTVVAPLEVAVSGRVRELGEPLAGAAVTLVVVREDGSGPMGLPMGLATASGSMRAQTDSEGRYSIAAVEPGDYVMTVMHPSRAMPAELDVHVGESDERVDVDLFVAVVEGRVSDQAGEPLAGVRVRPERARPQAGPQTMGVIRMVSVSSDGGGVSTVSFDGGAGGAVEAFTDEDGRYALRGVLPDVELQVVASGKGLQTGRSEPFRVAPDEARRGVDLSLAAAGAIAVAAVRSDGSPGRNLLVTARYEGSRTEGVAPASGFIGDSGKTSLEGLAPGPWRVRLRGFGPDEEGPTIPEQVIEVVLGEEVPATFAVP